jgi:hypothetical protein
MTEPLTTADIAALAASVDHLSGPDAWDDDRLEPALIPVTHVVPRLIAEHAAAIARAEKAEARLAARTELDAAVQPMRDHAAKLRDASDRQAAEFRDGLIAENCDLRTELEQAQARLADLGDPEVEHRIIGVTGEAHAPTWRDMTLNDGWLPGVMHELRDVYASQWRPADEVPGAAS